MKFYKVVRNDTNKFAGMIIKTSITSQIFALDDSCVTQYFDGMKIDNVTISMQRNQDYVSVKHIKSEIHLHQTALAEIARKKEIDAMCKRFGTTLAKVRQAINCLISGRRMNATSDKALTLIDYNQKINGNWFNLTRS